jgi:hypothetical protein
VFLAAIGDIVRFRASSQMLWITARGIVARVEHKLEVEQASNEKPVHKAVNFRVSSCQLDNPVAVLVAMPLPFPARSEILADGDQFDVDWQHLIPHRSANCRPIWPRPETRKYANAFT